MIKNETVKEIAPARILLVDDDPIFRDEFIALFEHYNIVEASSGEEALKILEKPNEIDMVILDIKMSGMNGIEALEKIKRICPDIRVVISTAYSSKDLILDSLRAKADDFLEKVHLLKSAESIIAKHMHAKEKIEFGEDIDGKIKRIKNLVLKNCDKKITLNEAATLVCLSPKYLSRVFKKTTSMGFNEYALSLKVAHAKEYLEKTTLSVELIANKLGYLNPESLIRLFQKTENTTPSVFRRQRHVNRIDKLKSR